MWKLCDMETHEDINNINITHATCNILSATTTGNILMIIWVKIIRLKTEYRWSDFP